MLFQCADIGSQVVRARARVYVCVYIVDYPHQGDVQWLPVWYRQGGALLQEAGTQGWGQGAASPAYVGE